MRDTPRKWAPDAENFGGVVSGLLSFGGALAIAYYCDVRGYTMPEGGALALVLLSFVAWFLLFVPCCMVGMLIEYGMPGKRKQ